MIDGGHAENGHDELKCGRYKTTETKAYQNKTDEMQQQVNLRDRVTGAGDVRRHQQSYFFKSLPVIYNKLQVD